MKTAPTPLSKGHYFSASPGTISKHEYYGKETTSPSIIAPEQLHKGSRVTGEQTAPQGEQFRLPFFSVRPLHAFMYQGQFPVKPSISFG